MVEGAVYRQKQSEARISELFAFAKLHFDADADSLQSLGSWIKEQVSTRVYHSPKYKEMVKLFSEAI